MKRRLDMTVVFRWYVLLLAAVKELGYLSVISDLSLWERFEFLKMRR